MNLGDAVNTAFDLSFTDKPDFLPTELKNIGIVGGGTAGYLAALALQQGHPECKLTVIESSRIPVIGVGESSTTEIVAFLHHFLKIDPVEFFNEVQPTLKLGIKFDWGKKSNPNFNFSFFAAHHHESYFYEGSTENSNWVSKLMDANKIPVIDTEDGPISFLNTIPYSYHLDNKKLVAFLHKTILDRGIEILDREVAGVELDNTGNVSKLKTREGQDLNFDLYVDCSGFRSLLVGEALKTPFISYKSTLFTDRAIPFELPHSGPIEPYTRVTSMNAGWTWKIPVRNENHLGYVFSSDYLTTNQAEEEIVKKYGQPKDMRLVKFRSGRHEKAMSHNVVAFGNAYAFIEPLESTAIQILIHSVMVFNRIFPRNLEDQSSINGFNTEVAATWDTFRAFLGIHYKFNEAIDSPFWSDCRKRVEIGHAHEILNLFKSRAPLSLGKFGTESGYATYNPLVFNSNSYDSLLYGQGLIDFELSQPNMSLKEYNQRVESYSFLTSLALTQDELFNRDLLIKDGLLLDLFVDESAWMNHTPV